MGSVFGQIRWPPPPTQSERRSFDFRSLLSLAFFSILIASLFPAFSTTTLPDFSSPSLFDLNITAGNATLTHYDLPLDYVASCGCVPRATHYPTAAVNALVYGSSNSFGTACGLCYRLQLLSTPMSPLPPDGDGMQFDADDALAPSLVVKIIDACPVGGQWCSQAYSPSLNRSTANTLGSMIHFDLAWPSSAISKSFFPLDSTHSDYGVWWASYAQVSCTLWKGYSDPQAWGSDWQQQDAACCPMLSPKNHSHVKADVKGLPPSLDLNAQAQRCPSYDAVQLDSLDITLVPNTSNVLSRRRTQAGLTNSALASPRPSPAAKNLLQVILGVRRRIQALPS